MQNLLPIPSIDYFPSAFRNDEDIIALTDFLDAEYRRWFDDSVGLETLHDPARCPSVCLNVFGEWLSAGIKERDDDATKRAKIANAVQNTRFLSTWFYSAKPLIDSIVKGDSTIISGLIGDDMIVCGDGNEPTGNFWFGIGGLDSELEYGTRIVGGAGTVQYTTDVISKQEDQMLVCGTACDSSMLSFAIGGLDPGIGYGSRVLGDGSEYTTTTADYVEPIIKGTILVNVDSSSLSASDVEALKADLKDIAPAYFKVYLGYLNGSDQIFVPYSNGLVGS
jgi:hypothetical protein